jgi:hypothetical protein
MIRKPLEGGPMCARALKARLNCSSASPQRSWGETRDNAFFASQIRTSWIRVRRPSHRLSQGELADVSKAWWVQDLAVDNEKAPRIDKVLRYEKWRAQSGSASCASNDGQLSYARDQRVL